MVIFWAFLGFCPIVLAGDEVEKINLAVVGFSPRGVSSMAAEGVADFVRTGFVKIGLFNVVERTEVERILKEQALQLSGCTTEECAVEVGRLLGAQKMVIGSLMSLEGMYWITGSVVSVESGVIEFSERVEASSVEGLDDAADELARLLSRRIIDEDGPDGEAGDAVEHKRVISRSWLGVIIQEITQELAEKFGVKSKQGILITDIFPGSPADKVGIEPGDVILEFNGKKVSSIPGFQQMVLGCSVGEVVTLKIKREGKVLKKRTRLAELPEYTEVFARSRRETEAEDLGLRVQNITDDLIERYKLHEPARGVVVTDVVPDSPADRAGFREGDVIERIEGRDLMDTKDFREVLKEVEGKGTVLFRIRRGNYRIFVTLDTGD
jgi:S1-C subfamily serine protease